MRKSTVGISASVCAAALVVLGSTAARSHASPAGAVSTQATEPRRPVLLELFTSEGCSSCPPADRLLEAFDRTQPIPGADLIVLSEHVDYWNRLGWTDPFSSPVFTQRQEAYVRQLHEQSAYTPQLVIDGRQDVVGSDERAARAAILQATARNKTAISLRAERSGSKLNATLQVGGVARRSEVYLAVADDHLQSQVTRGENSGHVLRHVAVVRSLRLVGSTDARGAFSKELSLALSGNSTSVRVVAFLQDSVSRQILGAAEARF